MAKIGSATAEQTFPPPILGEGEPRFAPIDKIVIHVVLAPL